MSDASPLPTAAEISRLRREALSKMVALDTVTVPAEPLRDTLRELALAEMSADRLRRKADGQATEIARLRELLERYRGITLRAFPAEGRLVVGVAGIAFSEFDLGDQNMLPVVRAWCVGAMKRWTEAEPEKPVDTPAPAA